MPRALAQVLSSAAPIEELALQVARDAYPSLRVEAVLRQLDTMAEAVAPRLAHEREPRSQALTLGEYLHDELELRGNEVDYHDPRNSYLNEVLARKVGLPITLSVLWIAIGRRAGVHVEGIGFPGHFLARVGRERTVLVDPFREGRLVTHVELERLATHHLGGADRLRAEHLVPVDARSMLVRMLVNLKHAHERRADHARALLVCDRLVDLTHAPTFRRDRGLHALALGASGAALDDLDAYLEAGAPEGDAASIGATRDRLARATQRRYS
ncbi:MAG: transglutaminase-like domain-containing protein [Sandaracinaceae bacterium]|nr:transglutaminase-like domain-containing protein [Sandaracinaceae bacterium]